MKNTDIEYTKTVLAVVEGYFIAKAIEDVIKIIELLIREAVKKNDK